MHGARQRHGVHVGVSVACEHVGLFVRSADFGYEIARRKRQRVLFESVAKRHAVFADNDRVFEDVGREFGLLIARKHAFARGVVFNVRTGYKPRRFGV